MRIYIDDDLAGPRLAQLLRAAGHDVQLPAEAGFRGRSDAVHLTHALGAGRLLLSGNYRDFKELHDLVVAAGGHHPGLLMVRRDNDPARDLSPRGMVRAIQNSPRHAGA